VAAARGIELVVSVQHSVPALRVEGDAIRRVIENLLGNTIKFTPSGGKVEVRAEWDAAGRRLTLAVTDTGEGIPEADLERIFDKFGQAESRKAGRKMSTGLGLTFCKMIAEAHGGSIRVESELGRGSTFTVEIPAQEETG